jgi:hypothetical protein
MAEDATSEGAAVGVLDRPETDEREDLKSSQVNAKDEKRDKKKKGKKDDEDLDYEVEFQTPFGKLEFEFEPKSKKEQKDKERKAKAEKEAQKRAMQLAKKAEQAANAKSGKGGSNQLMILLIAGLIIGAIIAAYWLFARPGEPDVDAVPPELSNEPQPQTFTQRARARMRDALRAGRSASREAQDEQHERYENLTGGNR